MTEEFFLIIR